MSDFYETTIEPAAAELNDLLQFYPLTYISYPEKHDRCTHSNAMVTATKRQPDDSILVIEIMCFDCDYEGKPGGW